MSYTPMSDLGQQGLFDITRTLLQQPDLASLSEALSQLVKRSALADSAPALCYGRRSRNAHNIMRREKMAVLLNMKMKPYWRTARYVASFLAPMHCTVISMSLPKPGRSLPRAASTLNLVIAVCFL